MGSHAAVDDTYAETGHRCSRPVTARISSSGPRGREGARPGARWLSAEATAVGDKTMIKMFSRLEASVGGHEPARAFCAARSIRSRARRPAGVGLLAMVIALLGCACTDDGVETSRSGPVAHDPRPDEISAIRRATGTGDTTPAEATPYGWAGLERVGARAAGGTPPVAGEVRQPRCSRVVGLASEDAGVDPQIRAYHHDPGGGRSGTTRRRGLRVLGWSRSRARDGNALGHAERADTDPCRW